MPCGLSELDQGHVDVAIVGAGINGASAAQHLSAAGYRVLVVDQGDFADGATSRSSRLLHCGLRHLASGAGFWQTLMRPWRLAMSLKTVRHDMLARDEMVRTIPDRLKPIKFCVPIYSDDRYAPWQFDAAFAAVRLADPGGVSLDYRRYPSQRIDRVPIGPWLRDPEKLRGIAVFREYLFDWPERIALDALFEARQMGAIVRNYTRMVELRRQEEDGRWRLTLQSTGQTGRGSAGSATMTADLVLNLAGAWVDDVVARTGSNAAPLCRGMKGIHIAVRLPEEFTGWGLFTYNSIGEPLYCLPFRGYHYVGLTRTPFEGDIAGVCATDREIDWMISETRRCIPKLELTRDQVLYTWAGVNPLTRDPEEPKGSREIKLHDLARQGSPGMLALTGGPIMTHRRVARELTRTISDRLSPSGRPRSLEYRGAAKGSDLSRGDGIEDIAKVAAADVERCARDEMPASLEDMLMRRLGLGWEADQGSSQARAVAEIAAPILGWSEARVENELVAYQARLDTARGVPKRKPGS